MLSPKQAKTVDSDKISNSQMLRLLISLSRFVTRCLVSFRNLRSDTNLPLYSRLISFNRIESRFFGEQGRGDETMHL